MEQDNVVQNIERSVKTLDNEISNLDTLLWDYAAWDDTYAFIEDANTDYIASNLIDSTFTWLRLNLMLFIDTSGHIVFGKAFDLYQEEEIPITPNLQEHLSIDGPLLYHTHIESSVSGIISLDEGPMLVVSAPILTSDDEGPIRGTMIMGRYLDDNEVQRLEEITFLSLSTYMLGDSPKPPDVQAVLPSFTDESTIVVRALNEEIIAGYTMLNDIYGEPVLIMKAEMNRDIYQHSRNVINWWLLSMVAVGLMFSLLIMLMLHRWFLSRLSRVEADVHRVTSSADPSARITVTSKDELGRLSSSINNMLVRIEETYKREQELRGEREEEIRRRAEFTRSLVHELKTPLTPMLASRGLLVEELQDVNLLAIARNIQKGSNTLNERIGELIDIAQGELGTMELACRETDVLQLLHTIISESTPLALSRGQEFNADLPASLPLVWADEARLHQVLSNILGNAFKFTPEGGKITLRAREEDGTLVVEVRDTGPGVSKEVQQHVFDTYYRTDIDRQRYSGLGLGLAVSKIIIELHGGEVFVKSQQGKGSTFGFSLPLMLPTS
ncbi:CHASE4 domain-containing protein [Chloroflexota bacterium]